MNQEQLVYRYVSCTVLLTFLTEAVNFDRDGVSRKRKQHLTPFQQNTFGIVCQNPVKQSLFNCQDSSEASSQNPVCYGFVFTA